MGEVELFRRLAVALAIGLLIGLERGWQTRDETDRERTAGLRTFALTGLLGGMSALVAAATSTVVLAAALLAYTGALAAFSFREAIIEKNLSMTGVVAGILTFVLGAYAVLGNETIAVAAAVAMAILLALRDKLHAWIRAITWTEMRSVLVILAMSFLLLPILPNRPVDPWNVVVPSEIWLLAILIAVVSFIGYVAIRLFGERRGLTVASIAGGLASSTATTVSLARIAREHPQGARFLAAGVLLAGATMMARVVVLVGVLRPVLLGTLAVPVIAGLVVLIVASALLLWGGRSDNRQPELQLRNPFDLGSVLWLAGLIAIIMLATKILAGHIGQKGVLLLAAISGIADVDALTLSMTRLYGDGFNQIEATRAILVAVGVNTVAKGCMAWVIGGRVFGITVGAVTVLALAAMLAAFLFAPPL